MIRSREEIIDLLVRNLIDSAREGQYLYDIFSEGFKGYNNYSNKELKSEYQDVFNIEISNVL